MKKVIILVFILFLTLPVLAENNSPYKTIEPEIVTPKELFFAPPLMDENNLSSKTVKPEILTSKESKNYNAVNELSEKAFKTVTPQIDVSIYPKEYDGSHLIEDKSKECPKFNFVKYTNAELHYDKKTGKLIDIALCKSDNFSKTCSAYDSETGYLKFIEISILETEIYIFDSNGKYANLNNYLIGLENKLLNNWSEFYKVSKDINFTKIAFYVDKYGKLIDYKIIESSKNKKFDDSAIKALVTADPLPALFPEYPIEFVKVEFTFSKNTNDDYTRAITKKIMSNWKKPIFTTKNLFLEVAFRVDESGKLLGYEITKPSGCKNFDDKGIDAILKSSPFKPIPKNLKRDELEIKFYFTVKSLIGTLSSLMY